MSGYTDDKRGGDVLKLSIEIVTSNAQNFDGTRRVRLELAGVEIWSGLVYDTAPSGHRTKEWARLNALKSFASDLKRAMEVPEYDGD